MHALEWSPRRRADHGPAPPLRRYELRIGTAVSPALVAYFRHCVSGTVVPRKTIYRICVGENEGSGPAELSAVLECLTELEVDVLDIRVCPPPA
jgi:hypothetical protein